MTVEELLSRSLILFMQKGKDQGLEYVSRSHNAQLGWYFWLEGVEGVYEIELKEMPEPQKGIFYLRYYPGLEEEVLEDYSVEEQLVRFDREVFDDSPVTIDTDEHELCPCCSVPVLGGEHSDHECHHHHEEHEGECHCGEHHHHGEHDEECHCGGHHPRVKGIPRILKKFNMDKKLFLIGEIKLQTADDVKLEVSTAERLVERSPEGIRLMKDGEEFELVPAGGINRNVPGKLLAERFLVFFSRKFLAAATGEAKQADIAFVLKFL